MDNRHQVRSLCAVARLAIGEIERAGQLADDRHGLALSALERWTRHEATDDEVRRARARAREAWEVARAFSPAKFVAAALCYAVDVAVPGRRGTFDPANQVLDLVARSLVALGEPELAARMRVRSTFVAHDGELR